MSAVPPPQRRPVPPIPFLAGDHVLHTPFRPKSPGTTHGHLAVLASAKLNSSHNSPTTKITGAYPISRANERRKLSVGLPPRSIFVGVIRLGKFFNSLIM